MACESARMANASARTIGSFEMTDWRPIETAPRDGTPILIGCARTKSIRWAVWSKGFWRDGYAHLGGMIAGVPNPTDWMPLPEPPEMNSGKLISLNKHVQEIMKALWLVRFFIQEELDNRNGVGVDKNNDRIKKTKQLLKVIDSVLPKETKEP